METVYISEFGGTMSLPAQDSYTVLFDQETSGKGFISSRAQSVRVLPTADCWLIINERPGIFLMGGVPEHFKLISDSKEKILRVEPA